jgi:formate--tetrahydrofolate ligase
MFGLPVVIAVNKKHEDTRAELAEIQKKCSDFGVEAVISDVWAKGGEGGRELANSIIKLCQQRSKLKYLYDLDPSLKFKLEIIATDIYGADGVNFTEEALRDLEQLEKIGLAELPVCVAKTQYSLSDDKSIYGRPKGFKITVKGLKPSAGAGFVVAYTGAIMTMPGLPKRPAAENMDITEDGKIKGLF